MLTSLTRVQSVSQLTELVAFLLSTKQSKSKPRDVEAKEISNGLW